MTVPVNDRRIQHTATAAQVTFPYDFRIDDQDDIEVKQTVELTGLTNTLVVTTDFTVTNVGVDGGGDIVLNTGAAVDDIITITGKTPLSRVTDFDQAGDYFADEVNNQFDKITRILQENDTATRRALLLADEDTVDSLELPITEDRKSKFLSFDTNGDPIASEGSVDGVPVSTFMTTLLDDNTAEEGRDTLDSEQKVNSLPTEAALEDTDLFPFSDDSDSGLTKNILFSDLKTQLGSLGKVLQVQTATSSASQTITGIIYPTGLDNTIPQNTDGDQILTLTFTPQSSTSTLYISCIAHNGSFTPSGILLLCNTSISDCLALSLNGIFTGRMDSLKIDYSESSGSTSTRTYSLRAGTEGGGEIYINAVDGSTPVGGGKLLTSMTIMEIE